MLKINFFLLFIFLIIISFIFNIPKENEQQISKKSVSSNGLKRLSNSKQQKNGTDAIHKDYSSSITIFKEQENLDKGVLPLSEKKTKTSNNKEKTIKTIDKEKQYSTTEEVLDSLFPHLKKGVGQKGYDMLIECFPFFYMQMISSKMTPVQKEKYDEMFSSLRVDLQMNLPDYELTVEEGNKIKNKIYRNYIPKIINLFTKQQQKEFAELVEENIANWK
jgi:hypothetical protein